MRLLVIALAAAALTGCAGMSRISTYNQTLADAKVTVGTRNYSLWIHPSDDSVLVQRGFGAAMGQSVGEGLTLGAVNFTEPKPIWRAAAMGLLGPLGCTVTDVYTLDNSITWEAPFTCPPGVVPRDLKAARREEWRRGVTVPDPLRPAAAPEPPSDPCKKEATFERQIRCREDREKREAPGLK